MNDESRQRGSFVGDFFNLLERTFAGEDDKLATQLARKLHAGGAAHGGDASPLPKRGHVRALQNLRCFDGSFVPGLDRRHWTAIACFL